MSYIWMTFGYDGEGKQGEVSRNGGMVWGISHFSGPQVHQIQSSYKYVCYVLRTCKFSHGLIP